MSVVTRFDRLGGFIPPFLFDKRASMGRNYTPNVDKPAYFVNVVNVCTQSHKGDKPNTTKSCQRCTRLYTNLET